ncbi:ABC transporter [Gaeumannomyces tritici R3-111a-1]|uniref:ABC transporter n=1 Tax=Gaeumannomyces tritici (strain R3-111a-1) TaxID=644352 RepID=J3NRG1_GAET3|nr:ABC transporter [Gaeumannomyces tritici R3-111a-1]EJT78767.1 ABC transporter [Gaeumannomyces tritici R3-111a-1]
MPDTTAPVPPATWNQSPRVLALQESHNEYGSYWIRLLGSISASGWPQTLLLLAALLLASRAYRQGRTLPVRRVSVDSVVLDVLSQIFRFSALVFVVIAAAETGGHAADSVVVGAVFGLGLSDLLPSTRWRQSCLAVVNLLLVGAFVLLAAQELLPWFEIRPERQHNTMAVLATLSLAAAVLTAMVTPKAWRPPAHVRPAWAAAAAAVAADEESPIGPSAEETASFVSRYCWYGWLSPLVYKSFASEAVIGMDDLPGLPWYDEPRLLRARMSGARQGGRRTLESVLRFLSWELASMAVWVALATVFELVVPLAMFNFSAYFESPQAAQLRPSFWIALGFASYMVRSQTSQQYIFISTRLCVRLKSGMTQELYQTAMGSMELSSAVIGDLVGKKERPPGAPAKGKSSKTTPAGQLANLMSSDIDAIYKARDFVITIVSVPISCFFICLGLYQLHGWPALAGFAVILLSIVLPLKLATRMAQAQKEAKKSQDKRISLVSEYLGLIRPIKYFAWEDMVARRIQHVRVKEQARLWTVALMQALMAQLTESIPILAVVVILACHVCVVREPLSAAGAFTTIYLTTTLRGNLTNLGSIWRKGQNAWISIGRLDTFFTKVTPLAKYPEGPLRLRNASFQKGAFTLDNITLGRDDIVEGGLHVLSGDSGSGKTTLLRSILGEVSLVEDDDEGTRRGPRVTRPSSAVYASQTPWLMNMTIKDNIVFYADFDHARYNRIVTACCLDDDLMVLPKGGMTMAGENGSALSRGQRARVALARALYAAKEGSLVLLDDIFAALDSRTINQVWQRCFCSDLLQGRTVVLATRLEQVLSQSDRHFVMDGGRIVARDSRVVSERQSIDVPAVHPDEGGDEGAADVRKEAAAMRDDAATTTTTTETSVHHAEPEAGPSTWPPATLNRQLSVLLQYLHFFGTPGYIATVLCSTTMTHLAYMASSRWLAHWVSAYQDGLATPSSPRALHYLGVFALLCALEALFALARLLLFANGAWIAAKRLHSALVAAVLGAPLGWHDATPAGRVVNRLSRDVDSLDSDLNRSLMATLGLTVSTAVRLLAVTAVLPVFVAPALVFGALGGLAGELYTRAAVPAKRLVSSAQSPVFSLMGDTLAGLAVIRATSGGLFQDLLADRLRDYSRAMEANYNLNRWVAVRIDLAAACIMLFAGVIALFFGSSIPAAMIAFSMSQATGLGETILKLVRSTNDLEVELQSFARVREYIEIKPEDADEDDLDPEPRASWPEHGGVVFDRATVRYRPDGPDILRDVSLSVAPGERCAVVGRTGSGKSTLMLSLMRFTHVASGAITYGGLDVSAVPRRVLRSRLTVIPQEAVLLAGSVRSNLDPTGEVPDDELNAALAECARSASLSHLVVANDGDDEEEEQDMGGSSSSGPAAPREGAKQQAGGGEAQEEQDEQQQHAEEVEEDEEEPSERTALLGIRPATTSPTPAPAQAARTTGLSLDSEVEPAGANFSHGQRQILSLCRALVRSRTMRPPGRLMMLDEATASMDDKADEMAQDVLRCELARDEEEEEQGHNPKDPERDRGRTLITIAHRLSTIMDYDKVVVMDQGTVREVGVPRELEHKPGSLFAEMVLAERLRSE